MADTPDSRIVEEAFGDATEAVVEANGGSKFPAMSYEQGVYDALGWVLGESDERPLFDESQKSDDEDDTTDLFVDLPRSPKPKRNEDRYGDI